MSATKLKIKRDQLITELANLQQQFEDKRLSKGNPNLIYIELQALNFKIGDKHHELLEVNGEISFINFKWWMIFVVTSGIILGTVSAYFQHGG